MRFQYLVSLLFILISKGIISQTSLPEQSFILLHLNANDSVTTDINDYIEKWVDIGSQQTEFTQTTQNRKPLLVPTDTFLNNSSSIFFGGEPSAQIRRTFLGAQSNLPLDKDSFTVVLFHKRTLENPANHIYTGNTTSDFALGGEGYKKLSIYDGTKELKGDYPNGLDYQVVSVQNDKAYLNNDLMGTNGVTLGDMGILNVGYSGRVSSQYLRGNIVEFIVFGKKLTDEDNTQVMNYFHDKYAPDVNLGADITNSLCNNIDAYKPWFTSYTWSTGDTSSSIDMDASGSYAVTVTDIFGISSSDTVEFTPPYSLNFNLDAPNYFCLNDSVSLEFSTTNNTHVFSWSNGKVSNQIVEAAVDTIDVIITDTSACSVTHTNIIISLDSIFSITIFNSDDTSFCSGNTLSVQDQILFSPTFLWTGGSTLNEFTVDTSNSYSVIITDSIGCSIFDTIEVNIIGTAPSTIFTAENSSCQFTNVLFDNQSQSQDNSSLIAHQWNFGNGDSSSQTNPEYFFSTPGTYIVSLTTSTDSGCSSTYTKDITINGRPTSSFEISNAVLCSGSPTIFTNTSSSNYGTISSYQWYFNNASDSSTLTNPSYTFSSGGISNALLITSNSFNCTDTTTIQLNINESPKASFLYENQCVDHTFSFIDNSLGSISQWNWNFGNGLSSTNINPITVYSSNGDYQLTLTVTDVVGCSNDTTYMVSPYLKPAFNFSNPTVCANAEIEFSAIDINIENPICDWISNYEYSIVDDSSIQIITLNESTPVDLTLIMTSTNGCSTNGSTQYIVSNKTPTSFELSNQFDSPPFDLLGTNTTEDSLNSIQWYVDQTLVSSIDSFSSSILSSGMLEIKLITENQFGCLDSATQFVFSGELLYDLSIENTQLMYSEDSSSYQIQVDISSFSELPIYYFEIETRISDNDFPTLYQWNGASALNYGELISIQIPTTFYSLSTQYTPFSLCNTLQHPNQGIDLNTTNNTDCYTRASTSLIKNFYPNPSIDNATLEILSSENQSIELSIHHTSGVLASKSIHSLTQGLNFIQLSTVSLNAGKYIISFVLDDREEKIVFIKQNSLE